jgi:uncharacterized protein with von Willebrand factor type A (vWA) domain
LGTTDEIEETSPDDQYESKCCFIFIVDRSGSMTGSYIENTKQALKLFLQSLPQGSSFQIISFGDEFKWHQTKELIIYNDKNLKIAKDAVN